MPAPYIRFSLAYNDFFGGYARSPEIILQAITASGNPADKPEEIIHEPIFATDSLAQNPALLQNFNHSALRIEKKGSQFRFLYAGGAVANSAFHAIGAHYLTIRPRYIGLFALKGFVADTIVLPVQFVSLSVGD